MIRKNLKQYKIDQPKINKNMLTLEATFQSVDMSRQISE